MKGSCVWGALLNKNVIMEDLQRQNLMRVSTIVQFKYEDDPEVIASAFFTLYEQATGSRARKRMIKLETRVRRRPLKAFLCPFVWAVLSPVQLQSKTVWFLRWSQRVTYHRKGVFLFVTAKQRKCSADCKYSAFGLISATNPNMETSYGDLHVHEILPLFQSASSTRRLL